MRLGLQRAAASWGVPCSSRWRWASRDVGNWRCLSSPSDGKSLEKPDVQKLAEMARISVSEAEAAEWGPKIDSIVAWFGNLQAVNIEGVPPALRACEDGNRLRPDEPKEFGDREALVAGAPSKDGAYVRVPKIGNNVVE